MRTSVLSKSIGPAAQNPTPPVPFPEAEDFRSRLVPEVPLSALPDLAANLAAQVRASAFSPDVVAYVERGARLIAWHLCREFACDAVPLRAQRRGARLKHVLGAIIPRLPQRVRDALRRADERWLWSRGGGTPRAVTSSFSDSLAGFNVLLVDDAADSGRTIAGCRAWLAGRGVAPPNLRVAVLAATTPAGRAAADFWLLERNTRLPWSADSPERRAAEQEFANRIPPPFGRTTPPIEM